MKKKFLAILVVTLLVVTLATPALVNAWTWRSRREKALVALVGFNVTPIPADSSQIERRGMIIKTGHTTADLWVFGPEIVDLPSLPDSAKLLPQDGTADMWVTKTYDPETGFGTVRVRGTFDFGEYGSFEICGLGKCGGIMYGPSGPIANSYAWYSQSELYGYGKGALRGTSLKLIGSVQPDLPNFAPDFADGSGSFRAGEISYYG